MKRSPRCPGPTATEAVDVTRYSNGITPARDVHAVILCSFSQCELWRITRSPVTTWLLTCYREDLNVTIL